MSRYQPSRSTTRLRAALTWDEGSELALHAEIAAAWDLPVFFCESHSPWQRPSNENTSGLLRQYSPKGTNLAVHEVANPTQRADR